MENVPSEGNVSQTLLDGGCSLGWYRWYGAGGNAVLMNNSFRVPCPTSTNLQFPPRSIPQNAVASVDLSYRVVKNKLFPKPTLQEQITDAYTLIVECDRQGRQNRLVSSQGPLPLFKALLKAQLFA